MPEEYDGLTEAEHGKRREKGAPVTVRPQLVRPASREAAAIREETKNSITQFAQGSSVIVPPFCASKNKPSVKTDDETVIAQAHLYVLFFAASAPYAPALPAPQRGIGQEQTDAFQSRG